MQPTSCADIRAAIAVTVRSGDPLPDTAAIAAHVATCSLCRGALALLALEALGAPPPDPISHAACQAELAAFIDRERADSAAAVRRFPQIWWHLWTCAECAETYLLTRSLVVAARQQPFVYTPIQRQTPSLSEVVLRLSRSLLNGFFATLSPDWGAARGGEAGEEVLAEKTTRSGHQLTVSVAQQPDQRWRVVVAAVPPFDGSLVIGFGATTFSAPFDTEGSATIADIPAALLTDPQGPELVVGLAAAEG